MPPEKKGEEKTQLGRNAVMLEGAESDAVREQLIVSLLKRVHTIPEMIRECEQFSKYDLPEKMHNELSEAVQSLQSLAQYLEQGVEPTKVAINLINFAPVRRRLREMFVPDEAAMSVVLQPRPTRMRELASSDLYDDLDDTQPGKRPSETTQVSRGPVRPAPAEEGTSVVQPLPEPRKSGSNAITDKHSIVEPKKPWWKIW